jgi:tetratricopeptide (TPR) repeat protein
MGVVLGWGWPAPAEAVSPPPDASEVARAAERERAFSLLASGDAHPAAERFAELLLQDPADVASIEGRIRALLRLQDFRSALDEARLKAEAHPDRPRVLTALAEALFRAGRFEEIEPLIGRVAERDDAPGRALAVLARLYGAEGRDAAAMSLMARAVVGAPDDRDVLYWASGFTETRAGSVDLLERYLELAEGDDPDRIEAARSGIDVLRALEERAIWVSDQRPERSEIPLTRIWDPSNGVTQGFVIRVGLGPKGKPTPLLLDSGSPGLFVIQRVARKRGFEKLAVQSQFGGGGDQRHRSARGTFSTVTIGDLRFRTALASSNKQEMDPTGRYHGVIGLSVFNGYRITLDFADERLILEPHDPATAGEPYWTVEGQWLVRGTVGGIGGLLLFDSGATHSAIDRATAERLPTARLGGAVGVRGFGGRIEGARQVQGIEVGFQDLSTGNGPLNALDLSTRSRLGGVELSGFVGLDLLSGRRIVVDTVTRRIVVQPQR